DSRLGTSAPTGLRDSPVLVPASSTRSTALSEFDANCRCATDVQLVRVGLKPTLIVHVPPGASVMPEQFWLTTEKSPALPTSSPWAVIDGCALVKTSGPSPSLVTTTGLT